MSNITLTPEDHLKQVNLKDDEGKSQESSTDSIKIDIDETKHIEDNNEDLVESTNEQGKDESICIEILKGNDVVEKACKDGGAKEYFIYGYYGGGPNQASPPTTWVQFQGGFDRYGQLDPTGAALDYEPHSRNSFVMLVFSIVLAMLLCTAGFTGFVLMTPDVKSIFIRFGLIIAIPAMILMLCLSYAMACSACTRVFPCNVICLILAVLCMSLITAYITSRYDTNIVFYALIATAATVLVCICLACTSFDFTQWMLYVIAISVALSVITGIVMITMLVMDTYLKPLHLVLLVLGTILNVVILIMELQTILGGKAIEMGENDYALGAFLLYTSIIDIFLKFVQMLGILDSF